MELTTFYYADYTLKWFADWFDT